MLIWHCSPSWGCDGGKVMPAAPNRYSSSNTSISHTSVCIPKRKHWGCWTSWFTTPISLRVYGRYVSNYLMGITNQQTKRLRGTSLYSFCWDDLRAERFSWNGWCLPAGWKPPTSAGCTLLSPICFLGKSPIWCSHKPPGHGGFPAMFGASQEASTNKHLGKNTNLPLWFGSKTWRDNHVTAPSMTKHGGRYYEL